MARQLASNHTNNKSQLGCKRLVFDSNYFQSLHADNVSLQFTRVQEVTSTGLVGHDGNKEDFDIIIWATGYLGMEHPQCKISVLI